VTIDFARSANGQSQVVGTVYKDVFKTGFYESGDGLGGVQIKATNLKTGQTASTNSSSAGGYQMPLAPGNYEVDAIQNGKVVSSQNITVGSTNVKADFNLSSPSFVSNSIRTTTPTPAPVQAPAPAPAKAPTPAPVQAPVVSSNQAVSQPSSSSSNGSSNTGSGGSSIMSLLSSITSWSSYRAAVTPGN
jgi:cell division septation protein DedD